MTGQLHEGVAGGFGREGGTSLALQLESISRHGPLHVDALHLLKAGMTRSHTQH